MSINLPIVVYGNGELFQKCFTTIASIFGGSAFTMIFKIALLLAGMAAIFSMITKRDLMQSVRWFGRYYLVYYVLFCPKLDVYIDDRIADQKFNVTGLPLGLAIFASYTTTISDALTRLVENNFANDSGFQGLGYSHSGMMMASRTMEEVNQLQPGDSQFGNNLQSFIKNCSKVTVDNLITSDNLWNALITSETKVGTFTYNSAIIPCADGTSGEGGGKLGADLNSLIDKNRVSYGKFLFPEAADPGTALYKAIFLSYDYLLNMKDPPEKQDNVAQKIMQQVLLANIIQNEIAKITPVALTQSFGYQVALWLPLIKNISEIVLYVCFMFVVLLALFPYGTMVLKNYILLLLWLQTWSPLYIIINYIVTIYAKNQLAGTVLNLQFLSSLTQINADAVTLAGYLSLGIPLLAAGLMRGVVGVFSHWTHQEVVAPQSNIVIESAPVGLSANGPSGTRRGLSDNQLNINI